MRCMCRQMGRRSQLVRRRTREEAPTCQAASVPLTNQMPMRKVVDTRSCQRRSRGWRKSMMMVPATQKGKNMRSVPKSRSGEVTLRAGISHNAIMGDNAAPRRNLTGTISPAAYPANGVCRQSCRYWAYVRLPICTNRSPTITSLEQGMPAAQGRISVTTQLLLMVRPGCGSR